MGNLFGKEKKPPPKAKSQVTDIDRAVLGLKKQRDQLQKTQKQILLEEERTKERVRELLNAKRKEAALKLLKRKRAIEKRYGQCEANIEKLEALIETIKSTQEQHDILKALDSGNVAMKELHKIMSVEEAERIMDEAAEQQAQSADIDRLIATSIDSGDLDDLEAELDQLVGEILPEVPENLEVDLPDVPTEKEQISENQENTEKELVAA